MNNKEDNMLEKAIEEAMNNGGKVDEMPREEIRFTSLNGENKDNNEKEENISFNSIDDSVDNLINNVNHDNTINDFGNDEVSISIPLDEEIVNSPNIINDPIDVPYENQPISIPDVPSESLSFNNNLYNGVQEPLYNQMSSFDLNDANDNNSNKDDVNNNNLNDKKNSKYIGYNERLLVYILAVVVFGILSLVTLVGSISMNTKSNLTYKQTSNLDYKVGLKANNYYKEPYLKKGMQYIASLIDYIDVDFNYNFNASENLNYKYIYYINADVKVTDSSDESKIIYSKSEKLTEEKVVTEENSNSFSINENIKVKYSNYNDLVKGFKSSYAINANSNLELSLIVQVQDEKGNIIKSADSNDKMIVKIPLTEQMVNIKLDYNEINNSDNAAVYKELSISNKVLFTVSMILLILMLVAIVFLVRFLNKTSRKKTLYEIKLNKILKEYDRVIITSRKKVKETGNIVDVNSFEELLDARDNLEKPIIFNEIHKGQKSVFIVNSEKESYRYVLKQADLEQKEQK